MVPSFIVSFYSRFPLNSYTPIPPPPSSSSSATAPTLWIQPPRPNSHETDRLLSADVECLKWQAYIALRGVSNVYVRWDVAPEGSKGGALPNLYVPQDDDARGELLPAKSIPAWVDSTLGVDSVSDRLEGYIDQAARVESRAWVALFESAVQAAVLISQPEPSYIQSFLFPSPSLPVSESLQKILTPPPFPRTGLWSLLPPTGVNIIKYGILAKYADAMEALADRLGEDKWFLGSIEPTWLDALIFAYLYFIIHSPVNELRVQVTRRVSLVAWEWKARCIIQKRFSQQPL